MQQPPDWATEEYIAARQSFRVFHGIVQGQASTWKQETTDSKREIL